tara:strand:+ start:789 stop:1595 length:807 start_codon:yes stop_codon:yes gene_type:complete
MKKDFSISEIIQASKEILNPTISVYQDKSDNQNNKKIDDAKLEIEKEVINKVFNVFKKRIKKNTLKMIFNQEIEIEKLRKKNNYLNQNKNILESSNRNLLYNLVKVNKNNKNLNLDNNNKEINLKNIQENLKKKENEIKELKSINNNYNEKIFKLEESNKFLIDKKEKMNELINKLKFYQDENLRLSNEVFNSNKRYDIVKKQVSDLGLQKNQIQNQIKELNDLINKSNLVTPSFSNEDPLKATEDTVKENKKTPTNLDSSINKIFNK